MKLIDIHAHNGAWPRTDTAKYDYLGETLEDLLADLGRDRVSLCFLSSVTALIRDMVKGNRITYADAEKDKRLFAYTYWDPTRPKQALREAEKYRDHPKFIGFKTRPDFHKRFITDPGYKGMIRLSAAWKKPVLLHCWPLKDARALARAASRTRAVFIMVHACAAASRYYPGKVRHILKIVGKKRVLFGSDYGLISRKRVRKYFREAKLSQAEARAVYYQNAERIFGL
jgi:predicted TIM-barrel fold metal-dependent hydrolase